MSRDTEHNPVEIESLDQLVAYFRDGEKDVGDRGIGTEHEKFVFRRSDYEMVSYEEEGGIGDMMEEFAECYHCEAGYDGDNIVAVVEDGAAITLEPGGQLELSGYITKTVHETETEVIKHIENVKKVAGDRVQLTSWGLNPFFAPDQIPWMPKARYGIMREYLPEKGSLAHWMMKLTCTIQANFDYTSEDDAAGLIRTALLVSPIVSALFANSPIRNGEPVGMQTFRGYIWTDTDPDRTGWPEFMYREDWGYQEYLDYILDVPMFFIKRDGRYIDKSGDSFRAFIENGHDGHAATLGDFELHLSTAFPEVRMKKFVEVRGADGGPLEHIVALPALWKGLLYHQPTRDAAAALLGDVEPERHRRLFLDVYRDGLDARAPNASVHELARELVRLSARGLDAIAERDGHPSEAEYLEPIRHIVETGETLADQLLRDWEETGGDRQAIVDKWAF
jgi:glutamate--cysteine ligase